MRNKSSETGKIGRTLSNICFGLIAHILASALRFLPANFLVLCFAFSSAHALDGFPQPGPTNVTKEQFVEDLKQTLKALKRDHPDLYRYNNAKAFEARMAELTRDLPATLGSFEAWMRITRLLNLVCEEHTSVEPPFWRHIQAPIQWDWIKYPLALHQGKLVILGNSEDETLEVTSFTGESARQITDKLTSVTRYNGCLDDPEFGFSNIVFDADYALTDSISKSQSEPEIRGKALGGTGETSLTNISLDPKRQLQVIALVTSRQVNAAENLLLKAGFKERELVGNPENSGRSNKTPFQFWTTAPDNPAYNNVAYLRIDNFNQNQQAGADYDAMMRQLLAENPATLILDLSTNEGGLIQHASRVAAYMLPRAHRFFTHARMRNLTSALEEDGFEFKEEMGLQAFSHFANAFAQARKKNGIYRLPVLKEALGVPDYKGNLIILVSPQTHSAALLLANNLRFLRKNTKIAGHISAGSTWTGCAAAFGEYTLINTRLQLHVPQLCYENRDSLKEFGPRFPIDIPVSIKPFKSRPIPVKALDAALQFLQAGQ